MAGPWEKYQKSGAQQGSSGPWTKYQKDTTQPDTTATQGPPKLARALFPSVFPSETEYPEPAGSVKEWAGRNLMGTMDLLSAPVRALGTLRKNPETGEHFKMSDEQSNVFRPEMDEVKSRMGGNLGPIGQGATEIIGGVVGDPSVLIGGVGRLAGKGLAKVGASGNKALGKLAQELSGVSEDALRAYGTGVGKKAAAIRGAAGQQRKVGEKLLDALDNLDQYLPEKVQVDDALQKMPPVNIQKTVQRLDAAKTRSPLKALRSADDRIDEVIQDLVSAADQSGNIPAAKFRDIRKDIDALVGDSFGKESGAYVSALKQARHTMAESLVDAANASGNPEYANAMRELARKMSLVDDLKGYVGKSAQARERRIESFVDNLFNRNKSEQQRIMSELSDVFGEDFLEQARLTKYAKELGENGIPSILPRQMNGRSTLGAIGSAGQIGGGIMSGNIPLVVSGLATGAVSSPRGASLILGSADAAGRAANVVGPNLARATDIAPFVSGIAAGGANTVRIINPEEEKKKKEAQIRMSKQVVRN